MRLESNHQQMHHSTLLSGGVLGYCWRGFQEVSYGRGNCRVRWLLGFYGGGMSYPLLWRLSLVLDAFASVLLFPDKHRKMR